MSTTLHKKKIKVALMSYSMDNRPAKGTALYTRKLIEGMLDDDRFEFTLVHYERTNDPLYTNANEVIMPKVWLPFGSRFVSQIAFFWKYRKNKFDIIHWFQPRLYPFFWLAPAQFKIATLHGAGDKTAPNSFVLSREVFNFVLTNFNNRLDSIIADTEHAKREIARNYNADEGRITSIYLGGAEDFSPVDKNCAAVVAEKYGVRGPYILDVARLQRHKNLDNLILAYEGMRKRNPLRAEKLVIIGKEAGPESKRTIDLAAESEFSNDILIVDYIESKDLNALYSGASLFAFPSLDEGFGLPVVEAFASGVPVVTSNATCLPEVAGNAAVIVDPYDKRALSLAMEGVLSDPLGYSHMVESGLTRARQFTWARTVDLTKDVYLGTISKYKK